MMSGTRDLADFPGLVRKESTVATLPGQHDSLQPQKGAVKFLTFLSQKKPLFTANGATPENHNWTQNSTSCGEHSAHRYIYVTATSSTGDTGKEGCKDPESHNTRNGCTRERPHF